MVMRNCVVLAGNDKIVNSQPFGINDILRVDFRQVNEISRSLQVTLGDND